MQTQPSSSTEVLSQDSTATERKFGGVPGPLRPENNSKPETKKTTLLYAAKMVQQVTNVTTFLSSFKKDPEYVFVDIPKHPDGKLLLKLYLILDGVG